LPTEQVHHHRPWWKRKLAHWSRWLHNYVSMVSFAILFFFAATGITLNHTDWFASQQITQQMKGHLQPDWVAASRKEPSKLEIVEHLRATHHIGGAMSDFRVDEDQLSVSFKGPGYSADAFIDRKTGNYDLTENKMGFVAILNDLHKGRDTGPTWSWVIDLSAALMCFVSLTGFVLVFFMHKVRFSALVTALAGCIVSYLLYRLFVP